LPIWLPIGWRVLIRSILDWAKYPVKGAMAKNKPNRIYFDSAARLLWFTCALAALTIMPAPAQAPPAESVLFNFAESPRGEFPYAGVIGDAEGNLYGTASGGRFNHGVVYKVDKTGKGTILYNYPGGAAGGSRQAGVILDSAGNLYRTTALGGTGAGVVRGTAGNLYGTTRHDGKGWGVVYKVDTTGHETVLYTFKGGADGSKPFAGVTLDAAGNLYGTTANGGSTNERGVVFKVDPSGNETVLHAFTDGADGCQPFSGVVLDDAGNLYGTTWLGGTGDRFNLCGVVYKVDPTGHETVLYDFPNGAAGCQPFAGVTLDSAGNLYGTTRDGGIGTCDTECGVVYKLDASGNETVLYSFTGGADGGSPVAGVIRDAFGNLYGTTPCAGLAYFGSLFRLDATGHLTVLDAFTGGVAGDEPGSVIRDDAGNFYGTTYYGGLANEGVLYKMGL